MSATKCGCVNLQYFAEVSTMDVYSRKHLFTQQLNPQPKSLHRFHPRFLGNSVTDVLSDLQTKYDEWIEPNGAGGNLADRIPHKFSTAEHLLYDDYPVICKVVSDIQETMGHIFDNYKNFVPDPYTLFL